MKDEDVNASSGKRGPLTFIILASTGQDIRTCVHCQGCEDLLTPEMDLSFREILRAAARDDPSALTNRTLWACDGVIESTTHCQAGIDLSSVIHVLRRVAHTRGLVDE